MRARVGAQKRPIAVIGGGFSGTMAATQLARSVPPDQPILLCERGGAFGIGVAYSTPVPGHLLNVRAANMSAFASEPGHFAAWLKAEEAAGRAEPHHTDAGTFASRSTYGTYLKSILYEAICQSETPQFQPLPDEIVDVRRVEDGYELLSAGGRRYQVSAVVLATGHVPPVPAADPRYITDPWAPGAMQGLERSAPVLVIGTGLTMVDIVLSLRQNRFAGPIIAISRRGLLPRPHRPADPWPTPAFTAEERHSVRLMLRRLRGEARSAAARGIDWRAVIDSLRPITADIWRGWPDAERRRFLRHARRWWDVHRHRMAPPNAAMIEAALRDGNLAVAAGRIDRIRFDEDAVRVSYQPAGAAAPVELAVQRVIVATGLESAARTTDTLMRRLLEQGLVRWDSLGFGLDVTDTLQVIGGDGKPAPNLWALGPIVRGIFWECIAVPDIRQQAERFGRQVAAAVAGGDAQE
jgi:uncharacterized NAD(P)/FAD-binding protein YdhS